MKDFFYSAVPCGGGKTHWACDLMARTPGLYLYAVDRVEVMVERKAKIEQMSWEAGALAQVRIAHAPNPKGQEHHVVQGVRQWLEAAGNEYRDNHHLILIVSHEAMKSADLSGFCGWTVIIDEAPDPMFTDRITTTASSDFCRRNYRLAPIEGENVWSNVLPTADCLGVPAVLSDNKVHAWADFHRRVVGREDVYCDLRSLDDMENGDEWSWFSLWNPVLELRAFDKVIWLGNAWERTMTYMVLTREFGDQINWIPLNIPDPRQWKPRDLTIEYFVEAHAGTTYFWSENPDGEAAIRKIAAHIATVADPNNHLWSANGVTAPIFQQVGVPGQYVTPRQHGTDRYRAITDISFIYSAKPQHHERRFYSLRGFDLDAIEYAREIETIIQFAYRGALRDPGNDAPVTLRVYSRFQAEKLIQFFDSVPHVNAQMKLVDIGIADLRKPDPGEHRAMRTDEDKVQAKITKRERDREAKRRERAQERAAKIANGTYRGRGRPRKAA